MVWCGLGCFHGPRRRYEKKVEICHTYVADTKGTLYIRQGYVAC